MSHKLFAFLVIVFSGIDFAYGQEEVSLEQVVALAVEKNYDVRIARSLSESAETDDNYVLGAFLPRVTAEAATVWNDNEQNLRFQDAARNNSGDAE